MNDRQPIDLAAARAHFEQQLESKFREARQRTHDNIVELFRRHVIGHELSGSRAASAASFKADYPKEWDEALRQGPLGERRG